MLDYLLISSNLVYASGYKPREVLVIMVFFFWKYHGIIFFRHKAQA
jgi:hypothetical protein